MNRKVIAGIGAAVIVIAALVFWPRGKSPETQTQSAAPASERTETSEPIASSAAPDIPRIERPEMSAASAPAPAGEALNVPRVIGRVIMRGSDTPVVGATVYLSPGIKFEQTPTYSTVQTDGSGSFEFGGLEPGQMRYLYAISDRLVSSARLTTAPTILVPPDSQTHGPYTLEMIRAPVLTVRVTSHATGEPIAGAKMTLLNVHQREEQTSAEGEVKLTLSPEPWRVEFAAQGFAKFQQTIDLSSGQDQTLEVSMKAGGSVVGVITDTEGQPLKDATISARTGELYFSGNIDEAGGYRIESLPIGPELRLTATPPDRNYQNQVVETVTLAADVPEHRLDFKLKTGPRPESAPQAAYGIKGRVLDENNRPIAGAAAMYGQLILPRPENYTNEKGEFFLKNVEMNSYEKVLTVFAVGYQAHQIQIEAGPVENAPDVEVVLKKGLWAKGKVVDAKKNPIVNVSVMPVMFRMPIRAYADHTDERGEFELQSLAPDTRFQFDAPGYSARRDVELKLDSEDNEIVLLGEGLIAGKVIDEATGEPVTKFKVALNFPDQRLPGEESVSLNMNQMDGTDFEAETGEFKIDKLTAKGAYALNVTAEGYAPQLVKRSVAVTEDELEPIEIKLKKGGSAVQGAVVASENFTPIADAEVTLLVHKRADRNMVWFDWSRLNPNSSTRFDYMQMETTKTNAEGIFIFDELSEGLPIDILVRSAGRADFRLIDIEKMNEDDRLAIVVNQPLAGRIFGTMNYNALPEATSIQLSNNASREGRGYNDLTQSAGGAFDYDRLPPGKYTMIVQGKRIPMGNGGGFRSDTIYTKEIELAEGQELEITFEDQDYRRIAGVVKLGGEPLVRGMFRLQRIVENRMIERSALTDGTGAFVLEHVEPAVYQVRVAEPDPSQQWDPFQSIYSSPYQETLEVADADIEREFRFERYANMTGRIVNGPTGNFSINLSPVEPQDPNAINRHRNTQARPDGQFRLGAVVPGTYHLSINSQTMSRILRKNLVMPAGNRDHDLGDIEIEPGGTIRVTVNGELPPMDPRFGGRIYMRTLADPNMALSMENTLSNGSFVAEERTGTFEHHPEGACFLTVSGPGYISEPRFAPVTVTAGETSEITVTLRLITGIYANGSIGESEIESAVAVHQGTGEQIVFERRDPIQPVPQPTGPIAVFTSYPQPPPGENHGSASASEIPEGVYTLTVTLSDGRKWTGQLEAKPGVIAMAEMKWD